MSIRKSASVPPLELTSLVYLNIKQATVYLGCTMGAIRHELIDTKAVPYVRLGKRIVFSRADLDAFMTRQKGAAA